MKRRESMKKDTLLGHAGRDPASYHGAVNTPVYHASTIAFPTVAALEASDAEPFVGVHYGRSGTPTTFAFEEAVANLEGGDRTVALPSGLAAITVSLLAFLKSGDHVLLPDSVYFPTRRLAGGYLKGFGIASDYYDPMAGGTIADLMRPETRVVFTESPGSLTFEVQDIPAIAEAAHARGAVVVMDNTWSAGLYFQPFEMGVDVSLQAATKFIVGHSDAMLGTVTVKAEHFDTVKRLANGFGYGAAPDDCYLGLRGLRSLSVRMARHHATGLRLAEWLAGRPEVAAVRHPALPGCPGHEFWKRDFSGACGLFAVLLKPASKQAVAAMLDGMELFSMGYSWGGFESLILPTSPAKIRTVAPWTHDGPCLRIHTGLEDADDLIADLEAGLKRLSAAA